MRGCVRLIGAFVIVLIGLWVLNGVLNPSNPDTASEQVIEDNDSESTLEERIDDEIINDLLNVNVNDFQILVEWRAADVFDYSVERMTLEALDVVCEIRMDEALNGLNFRLSQNINLVDAAGNEFENRGLLIVLDYDTALAINCDNKRNVDVEALAETFDIHSALE